MSLALGLTLGLTAGLGLVLAASPFLWPRRERPARQGRYADRLRLLLTQAGLGTVPPTAFLAASLAIALAVAALTHGVTGVVALGAGAGVAALLLPFFVLSNRARRRRKAARSVWPDVVDLLVSAVRGGLGLPDAVAALAHTGPATLRHEFAAFERDYEVTGNFSASVDRLKHRFADPTADRILETLRMAREVGGTELGSVLRSLSTYLREDAAIRLEVEARQSWVVGAARIGVAAPWVVLVLLSTRPEASAAYNSPGGTAAIAGGLLVTAVAYRVMLALGRLPEERRWFG